MKFSTRTEVAAPAERTFARFADFDRIVRQVESRGVTVERRPAAIFGWIARFTWNNVPRELRGEVTRCDPPRSLAATMAAGGLQGVLEVEVTALDEARSQVRVAMEWTPATLSARVLLKSLKLVKGRIDARFAERVADHARGAETPDVSAAAGRPDRPPEASPRR